MILDRLDQRESSGWALGHGHGNGAVEVDHGGGRNLRQAAVKSRDALPIGVARLAGAGVAGRDGGLEGVGAIFTAKRNCLIESGKAATDQQLVPKSTILIEQQHRLAPLVGARGGAGGLDLHKGQ